VANQRAERLEARLLERNTEGARLRAKGEELERSIADLRMKLDATVTAHQAERTRLEERHATAEARWLTEVDRARQVAKEATKEHERQLKALRSQIEGLQTEREDSREQLVDARSELKAANAVREHLEERFRRLQDIQPQRQSAASSRKSARRAAKTASPR
jgi:chromosome segregation ATPase